jgi:hypothetical protein
MGNDAVHKIIAPETKYSYVLPTLAGQIHDKNNLIP